VTDPRVERLGSLIVDYSLALNEGQVVRIDTLEVGAPLALACYRAALRAGAHPYTHVGLPGLGEELLHNGSEEQVTYISPIQWEEIEQIDALVTIWSEVNTRSLSRVDPDRHAQHIAANRKLSNRRWERISKGEMGWCGTLFPTNGHAQEAEMSLAEYEDFVFAACHVHEEDAASHWRNVSTVLGARASELGHVRELRIVGPDTDLRLGTDGRSWLAADGRYNMPDGEVFTSPVETETEGEIRYTFPAVYHGREVDDIRLRFEEGRVVHAESSRGNDYLQSLLDMVREEGEVYADGELIWKNGRFLAEPALEVVESAVGG